MSDIDVISLISTINFFIGITTTFTCERESIYLSVSIFIFTLFGLSWILSFYKNWKLSSMIILSLIFMNLITLATQSEKCEVITPQTFFNLFVDILVFLIVASSIEKRKIYQIRHI